MCALVSSTGKVQASDEDVPWTYAITRFGEPELGPDDPLPYANPDAPKGGVLKLGVHGTFDSLNQYIVQGAWTTTRGMRERPFGNNILESLMVRNYDEPSALYGLLARKVRMPEDRSWIEYELNPDARFSDDTPVTPEDVIFSLEIIRDRGRPPFRDNYALIEKAEITGPGRLKLTFSESGNRNLPIAVSLAPVYSRKHIDPETFDRSTLTPPVASGPYTFASIEPGRRVVYKKNPEYWATDLPIMAGVFNFDEIRIDYFRDRTALLEAFKKGEIDALAFQDPARWENGFNFAAANAGDVVREVYDRAGPASMYGIAFNTRREMFSDRRVRKALANLFDFDWVNRAYYFDLVTRTIGYWDNSVLSSVGRPEGHLEQVMLAPYPDAVEADVIMGTWRPSNGDGTARDRAQMQSALAELENAGYRLDSEKLVETRTGKQLSFEIMTKNADEERLAEAYVRTLRLLGIDARVRTPDPGQFEDRRTKRDFDMVFNQWGVGLSPGAEQLGRWSSAASETPGSFNFVGAREPAIDHVLEALMSAETEDDFVASVRALDRLLISGFYAVPLFHNDKSWIGRWKTVVPPPAGKQSGAPSFDLWWSAAAEK
ncbi:MAG: extracellular solute-binding protein [Roseibium sp.]|nr:extracellular solute-binding protein [Roseibium sp.]